MLVSCIPDGGTSSSSRGAYIGADSGQTTCANSYFVYDDTVDEDNLFCVDVCPSGKVEATTAQRNTLLNDDSISEVIKVIIESSKSLCVDEVIVPTRPNGEIFLNEDFCICKDEQVASLNASNACASVCSVKTESVATLFGSVTVGPSISGNETYKTLHGFCNSQIDNGATTIPACSLIVSDGQATVATIPIVTTEGTNNYTATLDGNGLSYNQTYSFRIVETGTNVEDAGSDYENFRLKEPTDDLTQITGDLGITLVGQYTCFTRANQVLEATNQNYFYETLRTHYYYASGSFPNILPPGVYQQIFCHDYLSDGLNDKQSYSRLEYIPDHLALWDQNDPRFIAEGDYLIADLLIERKVEQLGARLSETKNYFSVLELPFAPSVSAEGVQTATTTRNAGFAMRPFIDNDGKSYCPDEDEYQSNNVEMVAIGQILGNPTEGIYYAKGPPEIIEFPDASPIVQESIMLIRESVLKKIWFHFGANQLPVKPTLSTENQATYFYWPPDYANPYVEKKGYQKLYTVKSIRELQQDSATTSDLPVTQTFIPHDRKAACIPKLGD